MNVGLRVYAVKHPAVGLLDSLHRYGQAISRMCFCKAQNCLMLSPLDIRGLFTYTKTHRNLNI